MIEICLYRQNTYNVNRVFGTKNPALMRWTFIRAYANMAIFMKFIKFDFL